MWVPNIHLDNIHLDNMQYKVQNVGVVAVQGKQVPKVGEVSAKHTTDELQIRCKMRCSVWVASAPVGAPPDAATALHVPQASINYPAHLGGGAAEGQQAAVQGCWPPALPITQPQHTYNTI